MHVFSFDTITYLNLYFLTQEELIYKAQIDSEIFELMINNELIPNYSYQISGDLQINNYVHGIRNMVFETTKFFHKSNLTWVENAKSILYKNNNDFCLARQIIKDNFRRQFFDLTISNQSHQFSFNGIYNVKEKISEQSFEEFVNLTFRHWIAGTFGVCVKEPTYLDNIFYKEYYQIWLNELTENGQRSTYSNEERHLLKELIIKFDTYASLFSPIDYKGSSRERYIDNLELRQR